jgi:hypothetical protein
MRALKGVLAGLLVFLTSSILSAGNIAEYQKAQKYLDERGEVYFQFFVNNLMDINKISNETQVSIDRIEGNKVYTYANKKEFEKFAERNLDFDVLVPPGLQTEVKMSDSYDDPEKGTRFDFYHYPTYSAYLSQMNAWASQYPDICQLDTLGWTEGSNGPHVLLCMRISNDLSITNGKPKYLNSTAIHGDEVVTYMVVLHLIDTLVTQYGKNPRITALVDGIHFYMCPLLNPDATYLRGDNSVQGARRYSVADNFDLNRNYPCWCGAPNHDKYGLYTKTANETKAMFVLHDQYYFNFASDDHGGIESIYYPYANNASQCHDFYWYRWAGEKFADQVHDDCNNNGYFTYAGSDGVGNWYKEMYESHGPRMDYQTYYGHGKGMGPETSTSKILDESKLLSRWLWLKEAYLQYMENLIFTGIQGFVTDSLTGEPIYLANMTRNGDFDNSDVYTDSAGFYLRFTDEGTFTLTFSHPDYVTKTIQNFAMDDFDKKYELNVKLWPKNVATDYTFDLEKVGISLIPFQKGIRVHFNKNLPANSNVGIYNVKGTLLRLLPVTTNSIVWDGKDNTGKNVGKGCYVIRINTANQNYVRNFILR